MFHLQSARSSSASCSGFSYNGYNHELIRNFLHEAYESLAPGGHLVIRDFVKPAPRPIWMQLDKATAERFHVFVDEFQYNTGQPRIKFEQGATNDSGHTWFKLDMADVNEFISHKDYVDSWNVERMEKYAPWDKSVWTSESEAAGFQVRKASSWLNDHTIDDSYEGHVKLFSVDEQGQPFYEVPYPDRTMLLVLEKPAAAAGSAEHLPVAPRHCASGSRPWQCPGKTRWCTRSE